jgi:hypothetical protein
VTDRRFEMCGIGLEGFQRIFVAKHRADIDSARTLALLSAGR